MAKPINKTLLATPFQDWGGRVNASEDHLLILANCFKARVG